MLGSDTGGETTCINSLYMTKTDTADSGLTWREKGYALYRVATFRPKLAFAVIVFSVLAALLEGIGLGFIMPIVEVAQGEQSA